MGQIQQNSGEPAKGPPRAYSRGISFPHPFGYLKRSPGRGGVGTGKVEEQWDRKVHLLSLAPGTNMHTCVGLVGRACPDPPSSEASLRRAVETTYIILSKKSPSPCSAIAR